MPIHLSKALGISKLALKNKGVFDTMLDFDSKLYIDPALLKACPVPEFRDAMSKVSKYFEDVLMLISAANRGDKLWMAARKKLTFGEGLNSGLGYSAKGTSGSGIGPKMAVTILETAKQVITAGIKDTRIFELVPILEENIGADRISDMISIILKEEFINYTERICSELNISVLKDEKGDIIIFVPKSLLNDLPIASQWDDVEITSEKNSQIRTSLNSLIGQSWKRVAAENKKAELKALLLKNPSLLIQLLENYKKRNTKGYDFELDHMGLTIWEILGSETAIENPLSLTRKITKDNLFEIVVAITNHFKKLIEDNGLVNHLYDDLKKLRPERFPQLLYYAIADSYAIANNLDLNREINGGTGALDFKLSSGLAKVNIELKYSSNNKLVEGFTKQLPTYNKAEGIEDKYSIYVILKINDNMNHKIDEIKEIIDERIKQEIHSPHLIVIDAKIHPSASLR